MIIIDQDTLTGITHTEYYKDGAVKDITVNGFNRVQTSYGELVPQFTEEFKNFERRKKRRPSMIFHKNGSLKSIGLEEQMDISTPMGIYPAELVTFYEDGSLNRVFPLNGQIDGYWSEDDEGEMAKTFEYDFSFGQFSLRLISIRFYADGQLKSLAFWPRDKAVLATPIGDIEVRHGFSLYKDGKIKAVEPAKPTIIKTPIGSVLTHDPTALGIHADSGSLGFTKDGTLRSLTTIVNTFEVAYEEDKKIMIGPREVESFTGEEEKEVIPVKVIFEEDRVTFDNGMKYTYPLDGIQVKIGISSLQGCGGGCSSCSSCG